MGLISGLGVVQRIRGESFVLPPQETAIGSLVRYVSQGNTGRFQPMNINFGLLSKGERIRDKKARNQKIIDRAFSAQRYWMEMFDFLTA